MQIIYDDGSVYAFSYRELREEHEALVAMADGDFLRSLPRALHLACIIGYLKGLSLEASIGDRGIVHELVHLLHDGTTTSIERIRQEFADRLMLAP